MTKSSSKSSLDDHGKLPEGSGGSRTEGSSATEGSSRPASAERQPPRLPSRRKGWFGRDQSQSIAFYGEFYRSTDES